MPVSTPKIHYNKVIYGKDVKTKEFKKRKDLVLKNVDVDTNLPELPKTPLAALPVLETEDLYEFIEENKKKTSGNYDAMVAKVSNFSWSLNDDLSYDITLDLVSVGDVIDSLKMNFGGINIT